MTGSFVCPLCRRLCPNSWAYWLDDYYAPRDGEYVCPQCLPDSHPPIRYSAWEKLCLMADRDPVTLSETLWSGAAWLLSALLVIGSVLGLYALLGWGGCYE